MNTRTEVKIGLIVVLAGLIFYTGIRFFKDLPIFKQAITYHTELSNSLGLVRGNAVALNGVSVGIVTKVEFIPTGIHVAFSVQDDVVLTRGALASVGGMGLVGSVQLNLTPGPIDTPIYPPGSLIPSTIQPDIFTDLANRTPEVLSRVDTVLAGSSLAISAATELLTEPEGQMQLTLEAIRSSADAFQAVLLAEQGSLQSVLKDIENLSSVVEAFTADSLGSTTANIKEAVDRLSVNLELLEATTHELNTLLSSINDGQGTLGKLATEDSLYLEMHGASAALRRILENFEENPRQYLEHLKLIDLF